MLSKLRARISMKQLQRQQPPPQPIRPLLFLEQMESMLMLVADSPASDVEYLITFCHELQSHRKRVHLFTYCDAKQLPEYLVAHDVLTVLRPSDVNWLFKPRNEEIRSLLATPFDYLVDFAGDAVLPLSWLKREVRATLRVGFRQCCGGLDDVTIQTAQGTPIKDQVELLLKYLSPQELEGDRGY